MDFEKATSADIQGILELQRKNLIHNLTDAEKKDGFLSVEFTQQQFETMNNQSGIIVGKENGVIYGYLCTSTLEFNKLFALPSAMIALYPALTYKEKSLDQYHSVIVGPWCIERESRGKKIFVNMWNALHKIIINDIELLTTFISVDNVRSLAAAKKVGMEEVATFRFNNHEFSLLAIQFT